MPADPQAMAALHARCFTSPRPWRADEFAALINAPSCLIVGDDAGFAIARIVLDEAELLTICVAPESQNQGIGRGLLARLHDALQVRGVRAVFLEVAATNAAARALYTASGYSEAGFRRDYYKSPQNGTVHAHVMRLSL